MIETLPHMPAGVIGIRVSGRLSGEELRSITPSLTAALDAGEIRIVEVIADEYEGFGPGGLAEDIKLGLGTVLTHYGSFRRIAIVTDKDWVRRTLHALAWLVPGELAVFGLDELDRATVWAADSTS